ncbi:hypothetical protein J6590_093886 [Homalodisca vitripennis]|nr:hypothetical protein J6590_093886 [Homalodisca vitripennis]
MTGYNLRTDEMELVTEAHIVFPLMFGVNEYVANGFDPEKHWISWQWGKYGSKVTTRLATPFLCEINGITVAVDSDEEPEFRKAELMSKAKSVLDLHNGHSDRTAAGEQQTTQLRDTTPDLGPDNQSRNLLSLV